MARCGGDLGCLVAQGSRGYAISRSMDARIALAALKAAIRSRSAGHWLHSSFRSRFTYASEIYRELLAAQGLIGSMSRRVNHMTTP